MFLYKRALVRHNSVQSSSRAGVYSRLYLDENGDGDDAVRRIQRFAVSAVQLSVESKDLYLYTMDNIIVPTLLQGVSTAHYSTLLRKCNCCVPKCFKI